MLLDCQNIAACGACDYRMARGLSVPAHGNLAGAPLQEPSSSVS